MAHKQRLDLLLVERGFAVSRTQAQALIMAGSVSAGGRRLDKPGLAVASDLEIHVRDQPKYVSRAGDKLASVAATLGLNFTDVRLLDVGSSTGGFTDYALQNGAKAVICVDVGTGQLAYKLRQDPRITVMEQTDIREAHLDAPADMAVMDVSFVSLTKVLMPTAALVKPGGYIVAMAKPQFEAGKPVADRYRGVIPVGPVRDEILHGLESWLLEHSFEIIAQADSGLAGAEGNVEHFYLLRAVTR